MAASPGITSEILLFSRIKKIKFMKHGILVSHKVACCRASRSLESLRASILKQRHLKLGNARLISPFLPFRYIQNHICKNKEEMFSLNTFNRLMF